MLLGSVWKSLRQKRDWSLSQLSHVSRGVLGNPRLLFKIMRMLRLPAFASAIASDPRFPFKCLNREYLVRELSTSSRAASFFHHYTRLIAILPDTLLRQFLDRDLTLLELRERDRRYRVAAGLSKYVSLEGELSLNLQVDDEVVFILSFTIVPGWVAGIEAPDVLLITRLQGVKGHPSEIRDATRAFNDVAPAALLVTVLQGVAQAFRVPGLAGISAVANPSWCQEYSAPLKAAYDDFFVELGGVRNQVDFFSIPVSIQDKPSAPTSASHKNRTRKKRAFKQQIADHVREVLCQSGEGTSPDPSIHRSQTDESDQPQVQTRSLFRTASDNVR
jgi:uncharacterized protein